jgi:carnitine O-acetyltransferase
MSTGRQFTPPKPLDGQLTPRSRQDSVIMASDQKRSMANAKEVTQDFDKSKQEPLAASKDKVSQPGITFAAQDSLPKLPIPDLESTLKKYLKALDPLQTAREHADSERAVTEFLRTDGPGLQEKLKGYAEGQSSYIEQFCKFSHLRGSPIFANNYQGTTLTSTSTTQSFSTSIRFSFWKMTLHQRATTRSRVRPLSSYHPCLLPEL